jgi:type I restriction enzyme S subunit
MLLRPDPNKVSSDWLAYFLRSPETLGRLLSYSGGSTVAHVNVADVKTFQVDVPPLEAQHRVAAVLRALDDKIDADRQSAESAIAVLHCFGNEAVRTASSTAPLDSIAVQSKSPGHAAAYVGLAEMVPGSTLLSHIAAKPPGGATWHFQRGDFLYGKLRPYFKKVAVAPFEGRCSREIVVVRPRQEVFWGLLAVTLPSTSFIGHCVAVSTGTRMPRAEWKEAARFEVGVPDVETLSQLDDLARTTYDLALANVERIRRLAEIRDLLLPKLISGAVRVPATTDEVEAMETVVDVAENATADEA